MPKVGRLRPRFRNDNTESVKRDLMQATPLTLQGRASRWPGVFSDDTREVHCLAIGVHEPVLKAIQTELNAQEAVTMLRVLGLWAEGGPYVTGAMKGRDWLNLDGRMASPIPTIKRRVSPDDPSYSPCTRANALPGRDFENLGNTLVPKRGRICPEDRRRHPEATRGPQAVLRSPRSERGHPPCARGAAQPEGMRSGDAFRFHRSGSVSRTRRFRFPRNGVPGSRRCAGRPGEDRPGA